jgi:tetratricopeptide (TPR) repeat protein
MSPSIHDPILDIIQSLLPKDAIILCFDNQTTTSSYQTYDIDGNNQDEILFACQFLQGGSEQSTIQVALAKKFIKGWKLVWESKSLALGIDFLTLKDLTGDGVPEIIIGWASGTGLENGLDIYYFIDMILFETSRSFSTVYSSIEIREMIGLHEKKNMNDKPEVIIWKKEVENSYSVDILQFSDIMTLTQYTLEPIPLNEYYPHYFKSVVSYYSPLVEKYPDQTAYWYYYSLSLLYSNQYEEALDACLKGIASNKHVTSFPFSYDYMYLHGRILMKLHDFSMAKTQFENIQSYFREKKTASVGEDNILCQATLCLSEISLHEDNVIQAFQFAEHAQEYLESVFQSQSQPKKISKIPLDVFVSKVDFQVLQEKVQTHFSYKYLRKKLPELSEGNNIIYVSSEIYPNQNCELHVHIKTLYHPLLTSCKVIDFSDIQPEFYFMNGIDNGLLHHAILWNDGKQDTLQMVTKPLQSSWPLNEKSRIDQIFIQDSLQNLYLFVYKDNPMILLTRLDKEQNQWIIEWYPNQQEWRGQNGVLEISPSQNQIVTIGTSLDNDDVANRLFIESMNSLYRSFRDTWKYDPSNKTFQCVAKRVEESPYSSLVDFIYHVSTHQKEEAFQLFDDMEIATEFDFTQLIQNPLKQDWDIVFYDSIDVFHAQIQIETRKGYEFLFFFTYIGSQWKISSIRKVK